MSGRFVRLETPRLVVRRFLPDDAPELAGYRSVAAVARFQAWDTPFPLERAESFVSWLRDHEPDVAGQWYQLAIAERAAPHLLVGDLGFRPDQDEPRIVEVGFTLAPSVQGRGYASEALAALLGWLFETRAKHKVVAGCDTRNSPSWRLLERLGFRREAELREQFHDGTGWASEYRYGLLAADWRARRA